jgi:hypothetical protein
VKDKSQRISSVQEGGCASDQSPRPRVSVRRDSFFRPDSMFPVSLCRPGSHTHCADGQRLLVAQKALRVIGTHTGWFRSLLSHELTVRARWAWPIQRGGSRNQDLSPTIGGRPGSNTSVTNMSWFPIPSIPIDDRSCSSATRDRSPSDRSIRVAGFRGFRGFWRNGGLYRFGRDYSGPGPWNQGDRRYLPLKYVHARVKRAFPLRRGVNRRSWPG